MALQNTITPNAIKCLKERVVCEMNTGKNKIGETPMRDPYKKIGCDAITARSSLFHRVQIIQATAKAIQVPHMAKPPARTPGVK
mmetsp:Transcript_18883/g.51739  ORF Transcript_18883/g.51739 Transcript_18883/m.51739 type:complete len:84 (-) Transcript_18883:2003-2254(-)